MIFVGCCGYDLFFRNKSVQKTFLINETPIGKSGQVNHGQVFSKLKKGLGCQAMFATLNYEKRVWRGNSSVSTSLLFPCWCGEV